MTPQNFIAKGFPVSLHIDQTVIDRAEADARAAYVTPIAGTLTGTVVDDAVYNLTFLLLTQRNVFATRAGAKTKTTLQSQEADAWQQLQDQAHVCAMKIEALRGLVGANKDARVNDICRIYFKTNFFNS